SGFLTWTQETFSLALNNWRYFLGTETESPVAPAVPVLSATTTASVVDVKALEEKIKTEVRAELRQELAQILRQSTSNNISPSGQSGLIVTPSTGNASGDADLKNKIEAMFSDRVTVQFDANRKAGIIAPVFAPPGSDNYIFLLAPVKK
ncbi:MAG: hypothetical protein AAB900_02020, partial [Patescibacteria group bacterium]